MDNLCYKYVNALPNICCSLVTRCRYYMNLMQVESTRLSALENDCNLSLDQFYGLKKELDYYINSALTVKIMNITNADEAESCIDLVEEFSDYAMAVWQVGTAKLAQYGKNTQYISLTGRPLSTVVFGIQEHVDEANAAINNISSHTYCRATLYTMATEIANEYQHRFSTADACLRQYVYLKNSISFLTNLKHFTEMYMICPNNYSVKNLYDELVNGIIPMSNGGSKEDSEVMKPLRYVIDLLTGKLLGDNYVLDQNSLIQPVVSSDKTLKKNQLVKEIVEWLLSHYNTSIADENIQHFDDKPHNCYINHNDVRNPKYDVNTISPFFINQPQLTYPNICEMFAPYYDGLYTNASFQESQQLNDITGLYSSHGYWRLNSKGFPMAKRGRKAGSSKLMSSVPSYTDLQPIKIPKLKMDLIKPLT